MNQKMKEDGITPKETRYQTEKQFLRDAIDDAASTARSPEEFSKILDKNITSSSRSVETDIAIFTLAEKIYHWKESRNQIHRRFSLESV